MQTAQNSFSLDFRDNPELKAAFEGKRVGDKVEIEITAQINSINEEQMSGTIEEIETEPEEKGDKGEESEGMMGGGEGMEEDGETAVKPDTVAPVMIVIGRKK